MADTRQTNRPRGGHGHGPGSHGFQRPKDIKGTFRKLMGYVGRYKGSLVLVAVCLVVSSGASVATSYMLKPLLNSYIIPGDFPGLFKMLLLMGGLFALSSLCSYAYARIMVHVAQHTVAALRQDLFDRLQELPVSYYDRHQSGDLMSRFTNDIDTISEMLNSSFASIISNVLTFVGTVAMMIVLNPWLTLITFLFLGLMAVVVKTIGGRSRTNFQRQQAALGAMNGYIEEMIEGQKVIKVFNHEDEAITRFTGLNGSYRDAATAAQAYAGMMMPAMGNLSKINYAVTCCVGGLLAIGGVFDVGSLGAYLLYVKQVSQPVGQISQQINTLLAAAAGAERIFAVMEEQPEADDGKTVIVRVEKNGDTLTETAERTGHWAWKKPDGTLVELRGDVRFDHVTFSYDGEKTVLSDVSLFAKPGQKIAFVGSTGAGKTTITNLINRFYDVQQGTITYDGIDVKDIAKDSLRRSLGIVLQDTHLFTGTVADNIRYGKLDATDEEVRAAAKLANADAFIRHLPQGYDTVITGDGGSLSQGERQLLAIARAAVSDPPVLILDEATSSIDTRTETLIERGMDSLMEGRTVFVIAHRLSTVRNSQAILVLEQGRIIERGDHAGLLAQHGKYYQLYTGQAELS
jgi:ATP-binding cassette subfamily B multidrug efflux pump